MFSGDFYENENIHDVLLQTVLLHVTSFEINKYIYKPKYQSR